MQLICKLILVATAKYFTPAITEQTHRQKKHLGQKKYLSLDQLVLVEKKDNVPDKKPFFIPETEAAVPKVHMHLAELI